MLCSTDNSTSKNLIELNEVSVSYPGSITAIDCLTLSVTKGECIFLTGPSGSGKTSLLHLLRGLLPRDIPAELSGEVHNGALKVWGDIGLVFQNPETQLFFQTVEEEIAFGPENLAVPPQAIRARVDEVLDQLHMSSLRTRHPRSLSSGEKQRATLAAVLTMKPGLLLMDEPLALLDRSGREELIRILGALKQEGLTMVIADHSLDGFATLVDRLVVLDRGRMITDLRLDGIDPASVLAQLGLSPPERRGSKSADTLLTEPAESVVIMENFTFRHPGGQGIFDISLRIGKGEIVGIRGENGAGKTTMLRAAAGLAPAHEGEITVLGVRRPQPKQVTGRVALVMQNPERQIFEESVKAEVHFTLKKAMRATGQTSCESDIDHRAELALQRLGLSELAERNPLSLSMGEQRRVVCACAMAMEPHLLLLDEPTSGMDWPNRWHLIHWIQTLRESRGMAVIVASHDENLLNTLCDRQLLLEKGRVRDPCTSGVT